MIGGGFHASVSVLCGLVDRLIGESLVVMNGRGSYCQLEFARNTTETRNIQSISTEVVGG